MENSPPPSDYEFDEEPIYFTYPRPQQTFNLQYIKIDRSLIHPSLLGTEAEKKIEDSIESNTNNISQDPDIVMGENVNSKEVDQVNVTDKDSSILDPATDKNLENKKSVQVKKRAQGEVEKCSEVEEKSPKKLKKEEHASTGEESENIE